ncbi:MAG: pyrroline-5-carboxylate reductase [Pseudomonadota bacterium]
MNIAFIGGGNMASAMISGLLQKGIAAACIRVAELAADSRERLARDYGVATHAEIATACAGCDVIVLAVKPQQLRAVTNEIVPLLKEQLVVSIAAGVRCADLSRWLGGHARIVRAMPNTPALVQAGMSGLYAMSAVTSEERMQAEELLSACGATLWLLHEEMLDVVTAVSGSGPAYVFYFIEALTQAAIELGLTPDAARTLSLQTFLGAATLASRSGEDAATLRARVTSKGGTTERAIAELDAAHVKMLIVRAVHAAAQRARELGDQLGKD